MKIFTIYDSKAEAYLKPFFSQNKATALREFAQAANDETTDFNRHAADYTLMEIGTWDEFQGLLTPHDSKLNLGLAIDYIKSKIQGGQ